MFQINVSQEGLKPVVFEKQKSIGGLWTEDGKVRSGLEATQEFVGLVGLLHLSMAVTTWRIIPFTVVSGLLRVLLAIYNWTNPT